MVIRVEGNGIAPALPVEFLGGSAPRLRNITLYGVPYPHWYRELIFK